MSGGTSRNGVAGDVTSLLAAWSDGDASALDRLMPLVHTELQRIARRLMRAERPGHTLQTTAVVNEAYLRLIDIDRVRWEDRAHFFAMSARLMRRILVDHARGRRALKRGAHPVRVPLDDAFEIAGGPGVDLVALHDALDALASTDARKSQVVELRFFGGLSVEETAQALGISVETVMRDWRFARAWLRRALREGFPT